MTDTSKEARREWKCAGCGKASPNRVRSCDCPTNCVYRDRQKPHPYKKHEGASKIDVDPMEALAAERDALQAENEKLRSAQSYVYIGRDGTPVQARDLEDERDALKARVAELEGALTKVHQEGHSDTCSTVLSDAFFHPCDCHVGIARQALKENQDE